jgi:polar amino acid transport system substrate-binding protein
MTAHRRTLSARLAPLALAIATLAGCASPSDRAATDAKRALSVTASTAAPKQPTPPTGCGPTDEEHKTSSLQPMPVRPAAGQMAAGSGMAALLANGSLEAGVDENTLGLSSRNRRSGGFEGFEIAMLEDIAVAMTGSPAALKEIPVITEEKVSVVVDGQVDLTASAVSMTCGRWNQVLFTIPYFVANQKVMVATDRSGNSVFADGTAFPDTADDAALASAFTDRRVCATKGSTSEDVIRDKLPRARVVAVPTRTECLVALQDGRVDGILLHDTFLLGFKAQDPNTAILAPSLGTTHYGIAVNAKYPDVVRYLNSFLLEFRNSPRYAELYRDNFGALDPAGSVPALPPPTWID